MKTEVNPFSVPWNIEWCIEKCPGLCTFFFKTSTLYLKFMHYHAVIYIFGGYFRFFHLCYAQTVL